MAVSGAGWSRLQGAPKHPRKHQNVGKDQKGLESGTAGCSSGKDQATTAAGAPVSAVPAARGMLGPAAPRPAEPQDVPGCGSAPAGGTLPWTILSQRNPDLLRREARRALQPCRGIPAAAAEPAASPLPTRRAGRFGQHPLPACRAGRQRWGGCPAGHGGCGRGRCRLRRPLAPWPWRPAGGLGVGRQPQAPAAIPAGQARRAGVG